MEIHEATKCMQDDVPAEDWYVFEQSYRMKCAELAGEDMARRIADLDFPSYQEQLAATFGIALAKASDHGAKAIYFEYDLDNFWQSCFFVCNDYSPLSAHEDYGDDDWACDWVDEVRGPEDESFTDTYKVYGYKDTPLACGALLYLTARTIAALGRVVDRSETGELAIALAFHDQDPIIRIREVR